jgi:hypothetical protein
VLSWYPRANVDILKYLQCLFWLLCVFAVAQSHLVDTAQPGENAQSFRFIVKVNGRTGMILNTGDVHKLDIQVAARDEETKKRVNQLRKQHKWVASDVRCALITLVWAAARLQNDHVSQVLADSIRQPYFSNLHHNYSSLAKLVSNPSNQVICPNLLIKHTIHDLPQPCIHGMMNYHRTPPCNCSTNRQLSAVASIILHTLELSQEYQVILYPDSSVHRHLQHTCISWGPTFEPSLLVSAGWQPQ